MFLFKKPEFFSYKGFKSNKGFASLLNPFMPKFDLTKYTNPCIVDVNMEKILDKKEDIAEFPNIRYSQLFVNYKEPNTYTIVFLAFIGFGFGIKYGSHFIFNSLKK